MAQIPGDGGNDESVRELVAPAEAILATPLHAKTRQIIEYWLRISPPGKLPGRQHFEPLDVPQLLPNIWLVDVERVPTLRFRYRLMGTKIAAAFTRDLTGEYLDEAHATFADPARSHYLRGVVETGLPAWRSGPAVFWTVLGFRRLERIYLPMGRNGVDIDQILAHTVFVDDQGREV